MEAINEPMLKQMSPMTSFAVVMNGPVARAGVDVFLFPTSRGQTHQTVQQRQPRLAATHRHCGASASNQTHNKLFDMKMMQEQITYSPSPPRVPWTSRPNTFGVDVMDAVPALHHNGGGLNAHVAAYGGRGR